MRVHLGSDHAGLDLKHHLTNWLVDNGHEVVDHGPFVFDALDDYPVFCLRAGEGVAADRAAGTPSFGVVIGGSGNGEQMAANKVEGIRCGVCSDPWSARMIRQHNNANMLSLGARVIGEGLALEIVDAFLDAEFEGGRHALRVDMIEAQES